jgi:hypothetical protein
MTKQERQAQFLRINTFLERMHKEAPLLFGLMSLGLAAFLLGMSAVLLDLLHKAVAK